MYTMFALIEYTVLALFDCTMISTVVATSKVHIPATMQFSRSPGCYDQLRTFIGVSVASCRDECGRRARCQGVVYNRRTTQCILVSQIQPYATATGDDTTTRDDRQTDNHIDNIHGGRGTLLITGFNPSGAVLCGENKCAEHCVEEETGPICMTTECEKPSPQRSAVSILQGNMYSAQRKLIIRARGDRTFVKLLTCGNDGHWEWNSQDTAMDYCQDVIGTSSSSYELYMLVPSLQVVYCDMDTDGGHWLVFQRRMDGSVDFYLDWDDYVAGFGTLAGEFWLGLDALYTILLSGEFELRVDLEDFSGEHRYAKYSSFRLEGPEDNYRIWVSGYTGDAGDSLVAHHNGMAFSTRDADHDTWHYNCAQSYAGAWWYSHCHASNLNGLYYHGGENTGQYANHIQWFYWHGHYHSLKTTQMKIRRIRN